WFSGSCPPFWRASLGAGTASRAKTAPPHQQVEHPRAVAAWAHRIAGPATEPPLEVTPSRWIRKERDACRRSTRSGPDAGGPDRPVRRRALGHAAGAQDLRGARPLDRSI